MNAAYIIVTLITIGANAAVAAADLGRVSFAVSNATAVGVPMSWLPLLGALKAAGAIGLLCGLLGVPFIGTSAAIGLTLFFSGAVIAHLRARVFATLYAPGTFWLLAIAALTLDLAR